MEWWLFWRQHPEKQNHLSSGRRRERRASVVAGSIILWIKYQGMGFSVFRLFPTLINSSPSQPPSSLFPLKFRLGLKQLYCGALIQKIAIIVVGI